MVTGLILILYKFTVVDVCDSPSDINHFVKVNYVSLNLLSLHLMLVVLSISLFISGCQVKSLCNTVN